ncbi:MAG: flagellar motor protein MotB [Gaiella sp.]
MSGHGGRRKGGGGHGHDGPDERWLLTYADMITLLMALFIVMWSMSTVNISRFAALRDSLTQAFNGKLAEGGESIQNGAPGLLPTQDSIIGPEKPLPVSFANKAVPNIPTPQTVDKAAEQEDLENLVRLQQRIDEFAKERGLQKSVKTKIDERGLVVRLLTDELLFDSGHAILKRESLAVLREVATLLADRERVPNPLRVEGNTDNIPISTAQFPSNWELSAARATAVLQFLLDRGVAPKRSSVAGYADQRPIASNETPAGRSLNRRVELVVLRRSLAAAEGVSTG